MVTVEALDKKEAHYQGSIIKRIGHLPAGAVGSSQNPGVVDDGTTAPPAARRSDEAESHLVGKLIRHCVLAIGNATSNRWLRDPVTRTLKQVLRQESSGHGGKSQSQDHENLHADR